MSDKSSSQAITCLEGARWDPILDKICNSGEEVLIDEEDEVYITITNIYRNLNTCMHCNKEWMAREFNGRIHTNYLNGAYNYSCTIYIHRCFEQYSGDETEPLFKIDIEGTKQCFCHRFVPIVDIEEQIS